MITRHGLDGRILVHGEDGAIFGDDLLPPPSLISPFSSPLSSRGGGYHPLAICPILKQ